MIKLDILKGENHITVERNEMKKRKLQWHSAFVSALRITLESELPFLEIHEEYLLSKKPPQIDVLILKKPDNMHIKKSIGRIFRGHNILEYKSPEDYLSINDFYKVYGYACFYQSNTDIVKKIDPEDLTITFICSHYPRELIKHLTTVRNMRAEYQENGIYYLTGDAIPMQLIINFELTQDENYWLKSLRTDLKAGSDLRDMITKYEPYRNKKDYDAVMDLITRANWKEMKEVEEQMCDALKELLADEIKKENEKARAEGMKHGTAQGIRLAKLIFKLSAQGDSAEEIAEKCDISLQQVKEILE